MSTLSRIELNEEIEFFRDYCGWSDTRIEQKLGLCDGTLARREHRAADKERNASGLSDAA